MSALTVKQLIKELKKWPGDFKVATAFDDNSADEVQWFIYSISELEDGDEKERSGPTLVLRS